MTIMKATISCCQRDISGDVTSSNHSVARILRAGTHVKIAGCLQLWGGAKPVVALIRLLSVESIVEGDQTHTDQKVGYAIS